MTADSEIDDHENAGATVNFSVPDDVKAAFDKAFAGQNKSGVAAELMLRAMEIPATDETEALRHACTLAIDTQQHLFDTLYHAVALESEDAVLVTADERYSARAHEFGRIVALRDWAA